MKRIGIYAGSFDPVHNGHIAFALKAIDACKLDKIFFLPEPRPRYKQGVKALVHRREMLKLAVESYDKFGVIEVDQNRFTVNDTLPVLQARFKGAKLCFLLGDDKLKRMIDWPKVGAITSQAEFVIAIRTTTEENIRTTAALISKSGGPTFRYQTVVVNEPGVSSSAIRRSYKHHQSPKGLDKKVEAYIKRHGLYVSNAKL